MGLAKPAQVGVDITLNKVSEIVGGGFVMQDPYKTKHGKYEEVKTVQAERPDGSFAEEVFMLTPGVYSIEFDQGLKPLSKNDTAIIYNRSSLGRNGVLIRSSIYDPGFETPKMGAVMYVFAPVSIERHSRVAQIVIHENEDAELYEGQYIGEKDFR